MKYSTFFLCVVLLSCSNDDVTNAPDEPTAIVYDWIIPPEEVSFDFSPFKLVENPTLFNVSEINSITENTLVNMISFGDEVRIYPQNFVHNSEIVNDKMGSNSYAITYCPITSSVICLNRNFESDHFTIRASGHLYKENLVLHDSDTDTFWSQMDFRCIKGVHATKKYITYNLVETTWKTAKQYFPNAKVFTDKSINKNSASTKTSKSPPENNDVIYGIVEFGGKTSKVFAYDPNTFSGEITLYKESIGGNEIIIIGNKELSFISSYIVEEQIDFSPIQNEFPIIMEDSNGNIWNVFGIATSGPRKGQQLNSPRGFFASWWAWESLYSTIELKE